MALDLTGKTALITGASSGIGWAAAKEMAKLGIKLVLTGRRRERLEALATEIGHQTPVYLTTFDVGNRQQTKLALEALPDEFANIDILINNAGNAHGLAPFYEGNLDDWDAMIASNVSGLLYVSRHLIPGMVARGTGHVVNIGSIAGIEVYPKGHVYCATKHAVHALSQGMRHDLIGTGVRVTDVKPGPTDTEFSQVRFKGDKERAAKVYEGYEPLHAEDIADAIVYVITRPKHVNVADIMVLASVQASITHVHRG